MFRYNKWASDQINEAIICHCLQRAGLDARTPLLFTRSDTLTHLCQLLLQRGVALVKVKELLRHADIKTTIRCAHLAPDDSSADVEALERQESHLSYVGN